MLTTSKIYIKILPVYFEKTSFQIWFAEEIKYIIHICVKVENFVVHHQQKRFIMLLTGII